MVQGEFGACILWASLEVESEGTGLVLEAIGVGFDLLGLPIPTGVGLKPGAVWAGLVLGQSGAWGRPGALAYGA